MSRTIWRLCCVMAVGLGAGLWWEHPMSAAEESATITGRVRFDGAPPAPQPVNFGAERQCAILHGDQSPQIEDVVVNSNGTLRDVLVYVTGEMAGSFAPPSAPVVFEQKGCLFIPHVAAVMVGQPIEVRNDDAVLHNVRAQSKRGQAFNIAQPVQGMNTTKMMKTQEIGIPLKCDVHFWMTAYLHVLAHPFFAVTGTDGSFTIAGLSPGTYTVEAWHGKLGTKQLTVTVTGSGSQPAEFVFHGL